MAQFLSHLEGIVTDRNWQGQVSRKRNAAARSSDRAAALFGSAVSHSGLIGTRRFNGPRPCS